MSGMPFNIYRHMAKSNSVAPTLKAHALISRTRCSFIIKLNWVWCWWQNKNQHHSLFKWFPLNRDWEKVLAHHIHDAKLPPWECLLRGSLEFVWIRVSTYSAWRESGVKKEKVSWGLTATGIAVWCGRQIICLLVPFLSMVDQLMSLKFVIQKGWRLHPDDKMMFRIVRLFVNCVNIDTGSRCKTFLDRRILISST